MSGSKPTVGDGVTAARAAGGDPTAMAKLAIKYGPIIRKWMLRIVAAFVGVIFMFIQGVTGAINPAFANCDTQSTGPAGATRTGTDTSAVDPAMVKIVYDVASNRLSGSPLADRGMMATFAVALAESNFNNLSGGHGTSVGIFQQTDGNGYGSVADRTNPTKATNMFLDRLFDELTKGDPSIPVWELAQDVQRSWCTDPPAAGSAQDCHGIKGGNYKEEMEKAEKLLEEQGWVFGQISTGSGVGAGSGIPTSAGCTVAPSASFVPGATNVQLDSGDGKAVVIDATPQGERGAVLQAAFSQLGLPYSWGGGDRNGPAKGIDDGAGTVGFDCSGLTEYAVYQGTNKRIDLDTTAQLQSNQLPAVTSYSQLLPGDLIFWRKRSESKIHHVAIFVGPGTFDGKKVDLIVNAPSRGDPVRIQPMWGMDKEAVTFGRPAYTESTPGGPKPV